jgi:hypothetical protein
MCISSGSAGIGVATLEVSTKNENDVWLAPSVVPAALLHPCLFEDLARERDRLTDPVIDRMAEVLLVEDRYVHGHIRPLTPLVRVRKRPVEIDLKPDLSGSGFYKL